MKNPFTLSFGKIPVTHITRDIQQYEIIDSFKEEMPSAQAYIITGVRGSGKTVMLTSIEKEFENTQDWIVIDLVMDQNMLESFASQLYNNKLLHTAFIKAKIEINVPVASLSLETQAPAVDINNSIMKMLDIVRKQNKRVLIAIDEAANTKGMQIFASMFALYLRKEYPVFLLMTGLQNNISNLQGVKTLTFLLRTPKIELKPLNPTIVRSEYKKIFNISAEEAEKMAMYVKGYSFAFQLLGYLYWNELLRNKHAKVEDILDQYDIFLAEYVYEKIWEDLSQTEKKVAFEVKESIKNNSYSISNIREKLEIKPNQMNNLKSSLIKKGVADSSHGYGTIAFALPRFDVFLDNKLLLE